MQVGKEESPHPALNLGRDTARNVVHIIQWKNMRALWFLIAFSYEEGVGALLPGLSLAKQRTPKALL